jgi:Bacterial membrane protein YfhO
MMAAAVTALVVAYWVAAFVFGGRELAFANSDVLFYFYPTYDAVARWLRAGQLPLWNPYQLCGIPWLATVMAGFFYPPHLLYLVLPVHVAMGLSSLLHMLVAGLATAAFVRRMGIGAPAAALAAVLFTLRGSVPIIVMTPSWLEVATWLPIGCIAVDALVRQPSPRSTGVFALVLLASWLAGYPQITTFLLYGWGTLFVARLVGTGAPPRRWLAASVAFSAGIALGTLAASIQLLPSFELTRVGTRSAEGLSIGAMMPMGNPGRWLLRDAVTGGILSFGVVGLVLAAAGLVSRRHRALAVWAFVVGGLAFAFSLGPLTPLFRLYLALPVLPWFRIPMRIYLLADFGFAVLAAIGADGLLAAGRDARVREHATRAIGAAVALALGGLLLTRGTVVPGTIAVATAGILLVGFVPRARLPVRPAVLLVALAALELLIAAPRNLLVPYDAGTAKLYRSYERTYTTLAARAGSDRVLFYDSYARDLGLAPRLATRYAVHSVDDYEPVNIRRQSEYFSYFMFGTLALGRSGYFFHGLITSLAGYAKLPAPATRRRLLDLAAVRFVVAPHSLVETPDVSAFMQDAHLVPAASVDSDLDLFENPRAQPRAYVVHRVLPAPPVDQLMHLLADEDFDPLDASYTEVDPGLGDADGRRGAPATIVRDEPRTVEIEASLPAPGLVVLADSFYPGWRATVDGTPAPILATNHLFRGVPAPAGQHRIRFEYSPWTLPAGVGLTLASIAVIAIMLRPHARG